MTIRLYPLEAGVPVRTLAQRLRENRVRVSVGKGQPFTRRAVGLLSAELALERVPLPSSGVALGVLRSDMVTPGLSYVFGLAHLGGRRAVVSLARMGSPRSEAFRTRWVKEALHEAGHALGLEHCESVCEDGRTCVMRFSPSLAFVDAKGAAFCVSCARRVQG